jgi:hypothetical protein
MQEEIDAFLTEQQDLDDDADSDFEAAAARRRLPQKLPLWATLIG